MDDLWHWMGDNLWGVLIGAVLLAIYVQNRWDRWRAQVNYRTEDHQKAMFSVFAESIDQMRGSFDTLAELVRHQGEFILSRFRGVQVGGDPSDMDVALKSLSTIDANLRELLERNDSVYVGAALKHIESQLGALAEDIPPISAQYTDIRRQVSDIFTAGRKEHDLYASHINGVISRVADISNQIGSVLQVQNTQWEALNKRIATSEGMLQELAGLSKTHASVIADVFANSQAAHEMLVGEETPAADWSTFFQFGFSKIEGGADWVELTTSDHLRASIVEPDASGRMRIVRLPANSVITIKPKQKRDPAEADEQVPDVPAPDEADEQVPRVPPPDEASNDATTEDQPS